MASALKERFSGFCGSVLTLGFMPSRLRMPMFALLGIFAGLGLVGLRVSEAHSYLLDAPETCINCHIMVPQYVTWQRSSHGHATNCNDCHVPHTSLAAKYLYKARDGSRHSFMFTFRMEPQVIRASEGAKPVIRGNCVRCHERVIADIPGLADGGRPCLDCHRFTPHGDVGGLSATPFTPHPLLKTPALLPFPK